MTPTTDIVTSDTATLRTALWAADEALRRLVSDGWSAASQREAIAAADQCRIVLCAPNPPPLDVTELALALAAVGREGTTVRLAERLYARMAERWANYTVLPMEEPR